MKKIGNFFGNIFWFVICGWWMSLLHLVLGIVLCVTLVLIPFGVQHFKIAKYTVWPFGREVSTDFDSHPVKNLLWAVFGGWAHAGFYLDFGVLLCLTVVGIPLALKCFRLALLTLIPCGAPVVKS